MTYTHIPSPPNKSWGRWLGRNSRQGNWWAPLLIILITVVILLVTTDDFATSQNASNLLAQAMPLIIVAIGQMIVVVLAGMD